MILGKERINVRGDGVPFQEHEQLYIGRRTDRILLRLSSQQRESRKASRSYQNSPLLIA